MSILTQNEREGLEEVFLSIKTSASRYEKLKSFIVLWIGIHPKKSVHNTAKTLSAGNFRDKLTKNFSFLAKVKKNLSK